MNAIRFDPSIENIRKNLAAGRTNGEPSWLTKLRDALDEPVQERRQLPLAGAREYEAWLAAILRALAEARVASADWMTLITSQDSIWLQLNDAQAQLQALSGEELPGRLFSQSQMDLQINQSESAALFRSNHADRIKKIAAKNSEEHARTLEAHGALALIQFHRDTAPPPAENFARGSDQRLNAFDSNGNVLKAGIEASKYLAEQGLRNSAERDEDEIASALEQAQLLRESQLMLRQNIENLASERNSIEIRRELAAARLDMLNDRLSGKQLDFQRRMDTVVKRYRSAVQSLEARVAGFLRALHLVFFDPLPQSVVDKFIDLSKFDEADRGAQLDLIEAQIKDVEEWCDYVGAYTFRTVRSKRFSLGKASGKFSGECRFETADLSGNMVFSRVKGVRVFVPGRTAAIPARVVVTRMPGSDDAIRAEQDGWLNAEPATHDHFWAVKDFWNASVVGTWKIEVTPTIQINDSEFDCLFELLFDYMDKERAS